MCSDIQNYKGFCDGDPERNSDVHTGKWLSLYRMLQVSKYWTKFRELLHHRDLFPGTSVNFNLYSKWLWGLRHAGYFDFKINLSKLFVSVPLKFGVMIEVHEESGFLYVNTLYKWHMFFFRWAVLQKFKKIYFPSGTFKGNYIQLMCVLRRIKGIDQAK